MSRWRPGGEGAREDLAGTLPATQGNPIGRIVDDQGAHDMLAPSTSARPARSSGSADHDGGDDAMRAEGLNLSGDLELAIVIEFDSDADARFLSPLSGPSSQPGALRFAASALDVWSGSGWLELAAGLSTGVQYTLQVAITGTSATAWVDGVGAGTVTLGGPPSYTGLGVDRFLGSFGNELDGRWYELLVFNDVLSAQDRADVHTYLAGAYT